MEDRLLTPKEKQEALKPLQQRGMVNISYPTLVVEAFLQAQDVKSTRIGRRETATEMVDEIEDFTCKHINSDGDYIFAAKGDVFIYQIDWQTLKGKYLGGVR